MDKKEKLVPELRFKEFDGELFLQKLIDLSDRISDGIHSTPKYTDDGPFYFVNGNNLVNGKIILSESTKRVSEQEYKNHYRDLNDRTILMSINGTIGNLAYYDGEDIMLGKSACYINLKNIKQKQFIYYYLQLNKIQQYFYSELTGTTIKNLSLKTIKNLKLKLPSLPEQQKIANFLSAVDQKIQQLQRKRELLTQYKKGMMQQLFSQEIRFKPDPTEASDGEQGNDFPDWEEKKLGEVYSFYATNSFSRDKLNYESGLVYNIHYGDIHTKFSTQFKIEEENVPFINEEVDLSKIKEKSYCKEGDLIVADASEDYEDIGKSIELTNLSNKKVLAGLHTFLVRPDLSMIEIGFSGYLMQSNTLRMKIMRIAQGTKVLSISTRRLAELDLKLPSKPEQQKMANFLSALDEKVAQVEQQIVKVQRFKKGLLQKMFV